jgi:adenylate cyclase
MTRGFKDYYSGLGSRSKKYLTYKMPQSRQLAAIMFTDIVGYTALMGDNEQKAFELLNKNRLLQKPIIEQYCGRWIKELGDGVLASFNTVSDAVNAAIKIQESCNQTKEFQLRIGIHQGEVVFEQDDIFGDAVNIASRIQALAPIGGIWISESVHNNVSNKKEINCRFVRAEILKNVKEPVKIYELMLESLAGPSDFLLKESSKKVLEKSIAVLPFTDMSAAHDQEYLGDGLAEEMINILSQIRELKVIGRTSSFSFKNKDVDLKTIGKTLDAKTILEGSIQKSGNRLRITAQLVNAEDGYHIWSQRYDREMDDIFALQDDICSKIGEYLKLTLLQDYETALEKRPTNNLQAYEMFLKGDFYHKKYSAEGFEKAIEYFKKALELDPNYADAWWSLGLCHFENNAIIGTPLQPKEVMKTTKYCAQKAIAIDEFNADAHFLLALIHFNYDYDWKKVGSEIEIGKKYLKTPVPLMFLPFEPWYRVTLYDDFNFAIRQLQKGVENDPLSILNLFHQGLLHLHGLRDYEKTRNIFNRILELDSHYSEAWRYMSLSWLFEGNYKLAEEYARRFYDILEGKGYGAGNLILCLAASGKKEEAQQLYESVKETLPARQFPASLHATINEYLGRFDEAFEYLDKAMEDKEIWLFFIKFSPEWDLLRPDPRFQKVLERMNFPE